MRYLAAAAAYVVTLWLVFMIGVFGVISFVGPHSKRLGEPMTSLVYVLAGLAVLVVPAWAARAAFRAGSKKGSSDAPEE